MIEQNLFGDLFEEKKGELEFKSKKGNNVKITFTVAGGEDNTGLEDNLKEIVNLLEKVDEAPKTEEVKQKDEKPVSITPAQKEFLEKLVKEGKVSQDINLDNLTKEEASQKIRLALKPVEQGGQ